MNAQKSIYIHDISMNIIVKLNRSLANDPLAT